MRTAVAAPAPVRSPAGLAARQWGLRILTVLAVTLAWEGGVLLLGIRPYYLPRLSSILGAILATPGAYASGFLRTLTETLIGFAAGSAFGVLIAVAFLRMRTLRELVFPLFVVSQTIPVIAFGALVVLWFGNTLLAKAVIAFYLTFFPVAVNALIGLEAVDRRQIDLMRSFGASPRQILLRLQLPAALPQIFVALRLAASLSLVGAIVGEWFGDTDGLGVLLLQGMYNENVVAIWAALLSSAVLGLGLYAAVAALERVLVFWEAEQ